MGAGRRRRRGREVPAQKLESGNSLPEAEDGHVTNYRALTDGEMGQSEIRTRPDNVKVEMVWAAMNRAYRRHMSVRKLLMPNDVPSHQIGGNPPFATWQPVGKDGQPAPSPPDAAAQAEKWVAQDPVLPGAIEWFEPALQDKLAAQGAALRKQRDKGATLTPHEAQIARPRHAFVPFSSGPRVCIGNHFALMEGPLVLATLLQRADFALPAGAVVEPRCTPRCAPRAASRCGSTCAARAYAAPGLRPGSPKTTSPPTAVARTRAPSSCQACPRGPSSTTRSARLPTSSVPQQSRQPQTSAALRVYNASASKSSMRWSGSRTAPRTVRRRTAPRMPSSGS